VLSDNLATQPQPEAAAILKDIGAWFRFLPPCSVGAGPIGIAFARLEALLRKAAARTCDDLWQAVGNLCSIFGDAKHCTFFKAAGYQPDWAQHALVPEKALTGRRRRRPAGWTGRRCGAADPETVRGTAFPPDGDIGRPPTAWHGVRAARRRAGRAGPAPTGLPILQARAEAGPDPARAPIRRKTASCAGGGRT